MRRYIPLDAGADQLVHELVDVDDPVNIETRAEKALHEAVLRHDVRVILLTGDAGHGKTWLCARLLEHLGRTPAEAADAIRTTADGESDLAGLASGRSLRIVKDLSDFDTEDGAELVTQALNATTRVTVMCGNEGRLRDIVSRRPEALNILLRRLQAG